MISSLCGNPVTSYKLPVLTCGDDLFRALLVIPSRSQIEALTGHESRIDWHGTRGSVPGVGGRGCLCRGRGLGTLAPCIRFYHNHCREYELLGELSAHPCRPEHRVISYRWTSVMTGSMGRDLILGRQCTQH